MFWVETHLAQVGGVLRGTLLSSLICDKLLSKDAGLWPGASPSLLCSSRCPGTEGPHIL